MKPFNIVLELLKSGGDCILFKGTKKKILLLIYGSASLASAPELGSGEESWPLAAGDTLQCSQVIFQFLSLHFGKSGAR